MKVRIVGGPVPAAKKVEVELQDDMPIVANLPSIEIAVSASIDGFQLFHTSVVDKKVKPTTAVNMSSSPVEGGIKAGAILYLKKQAERPRSRSPATRKTGGSDAKEHAEGGAEDVTPTAESSDAPLPPPALKKDDTAQQKRVKRATFKDDMGPPPRDVVAVDEDRWHDRILAMYQAYLPSKVSGFDTIMAKYKGQEKQLLNALVKKYGPEPDASDGGEHGGATAPAQSEEPAPPATQPPKQEQAPQAAQPAVPQPAAKTSPPTQQPQSVKNVPKAESAERVALRERIVQFYKEHSPENLGNVEIAMGLDVPEEVIMRKLKEKYAPHLLDRPRAASKSPASPKNSNRAAETPERAALRARITQFYMEHSPENVDKVEVAMGLDVPESVIFAKLKERYAPHLVDTNSPRKGSVKPNVPPSAAPTPAPTPAPAQAPAPAKTVASAPPAPAPAAVSPAVEAPPQSVQQQSTPEAVESPARQAFRKQVTDFYLQYSPENVSKVETAMALDVAEESIMDRLKLKYAPHLLPGKKRSASNHSGDETDRTPSREGSETTKATATPPPPSPPPQATSDRAALRQRLTAFYERYAPHDVAKVEMAMMLNVPEDQLFHTLHAKYAPQLLQPGKPDPFASTLQPGTQLSPRRMSVVRRDAPVRAEMAVEARIKTRLAPDAVAALQRILADKLNADKQRTIFTHWRASAEARLHRHAAELAIASGCWSVVDDATSRRKEYRNHDGLVVPDLATHLRIVRSSQPPLAQAVLHKIQVLCDARGVAKRAMPLLGENDAIRALDALLEPDEEKVQMAATVNSLTEESTALRDEAARLASALRDTQQQLIAQQEMTAKLESQQSESADDFQTKLHDVTAEKNSEIRHLKLDLHKALEELKSEKRGLPTELETVLAAKDEQLHKAQQEVAKVRNLLHVEKTKHGETKRELDEAREALLHPQRGSSPPMGALPGRGTSTPRAGGASRTSTPRTGINAVMSRPLNLHAVSRSPPDHQAAPDAASYAPSNTTPRTPGGSAGASRRTPPSTTPARNGTSGNPIAVRPSPRGAFSNPVHELLMDRGDAEFEPMEYGGLSPGRDDIVVIEEYSRSPAAVGVHYGRREQYANLSDDETVGDEFEPQESVGACPHCRTDLTPYDGSKLGLKEHSSKVAFCFSCRKAFSAQALHRVLPKREESHGLWRGAAGRSKPGSRSTWLR